MTFNLKAVRGYEQLFAHYTIPPGLENDQSTEGKRKLLAALSDRLRASRKAGFAGSWTYDHTLHSSLYWIYHEVKKDLENV